MRRLLIALCVVPALALGAEQTEGATTGTPQNQGATGTPQTEGATGAPKAEGAAPGNPMGKWVPPKVKNEAKDKQEIKAYFSKMEAAQKAGDLDAAAALVDFPVTMITDNSKGEGMGETWDREKWVATMKPFYAHMHPAKNVKVTHKPTVFLLSDSLAVVTDVATITHGAKTITSRSAMTLVRKDGEWRAKTMVQGGWGDMPTAQGAAAAPQGAGSQGTGMGSMEPPAGQGAESGAPPSDQGTGAMPPAGQGTGAMPPPGQGTGTSAQPPPEQGTERTTK